MKVPKVTRKNPKRFPNARSLRDPRLVQDRKLRRGNSIYTFGEFYLNEKERLLTRKGIAVKLRPKAFDVLLLLLRDHPCLVEKARLLEVVWPNTFIEEAIINVNVATLRKALHETSTSRTYIETVHKLGYRFVGDVTEMVDAVPVLLLRGNGG